jgi:monofunctional chorismate mutase
MDDIESLRSRLDDVDDHILTLVARRMEIAREIGALKLTANAPVLDTEREAAVARRWTAAGERLGLEGDALHELLDVLLRMSRKVQGGR